MKTQSRRGIAYIVKPERISPRLAMKNPAAIFRPHHDGDDASDKGLAQSMPGPHRTTPEAERTKKRSRLQPLTSSPDEKRPVSRVANIRSCHASSCNSGQRLMELFQKNRWLQYCCRRDYRSRQRRNSDQRSWRARRLSLSRGREQYNGKSAKIARRAQITPGALFSAEVSVYCRP